MDKIYYELTINELKHIKKVYDNNIQNFIKIKGLEYNKENEIRCFRCKNKDLIYFKDHIYCSKCIEFGKVDNNTYFYQKIKTKRDFIYIDKLEKIIFTKRQLLASKFILSTIKMQQDCLIHAVCGAGKTEITFIAISYMLKQNKYICFAIPRIDILYEIAKRLKYYFPKTKICILNSNEPKIQHGQIYVMTTNQILRFKNAFSLIIVDEIDAYPFEYDPKYNQGVLFAKTKEASIVYLTSTPSKKFLEKKLPTYVINRRWHEYLLPCPKFVYFDLDEFIKTRDKKFINLLKSYENNDIGQQDKENKENKENKDMDKRQLILFISNIKKGKILHNILLNEQIKIDFVYSSFAHKKECIEDFRNKKKQILLTTSILERGVTFENVDVIVLDAHSRLYNKAALIQIAGRARRKKEYQKGKVYFYYKNKTKNMKDAQKDIKNLNK